MNRILLQLQEIDSKLSQLARERAKLDDGTLARAKRDALQAELGDARAQVASNQTLRGHKETDLKTTEDKIARQQKRVMTVSSTNEISALERDIEGLSRARGDLDETILELMDAGETLAARVANLEKSLAGAEAEVARIEADFKLDVARIQAAAAAKRAERPSVETQLSPGEQTRYNEAFKRFGGVAIAKVVGGNCSACGAAILPFTLREAKSQEFPKCEGCNRLIFIE